MNFFDEIECVAHSAELFSRDPERLSFTEADPDENRVKLLLQAGRGDVAANLNAASEFHAESLDHGHFSKTDLWLHLVIGDAIGVKPPPATASFQK